jgi:plastocyanin
MSTSWGRRLALLPVAGALGLGALPCHWLPAAGGAAALPGLLGGTAQAAPAPQTTGGTQEVRLDLTEWALTPARVTVAAGRPVRLVARNNGALPHALAVEGDGVYAETDGIGTAEAARLQLTFPAPGVYDLFCPVGAGQHRALGQEAQLTVVVAAPGVQYPQVSSDPAEAAPPGDAPPAGAAAPAPAPDQGPAPGPDG